MKGDPLPEQYRVVRYVGGSKIDDGIVRPEGFKGQCLSVNWLECVDGTEDEQLERVRSLLRLDAKPTAKLAKLNVGTIRNLTDDLNVVEDPLPATDKHPAAPCHAEIVGLPEEVCRQKRIYEALADNVIDLHAAK